MTSKSRRDDRAGPVAERLPRHRSPPTGLGPLSSRARPSRQHSVWVSRNDSASARPVGTVPARDRVPGLGTSRGPLVTTTRRFRRSPLQRRIAGGAGTQLSLGGAPLSPSSSGPRRSGVDMLPGGMPVRRKPSTGLRPCSGPVATGLSFWVVSHSRGSVCHTIFLPSSFITGSFSFQSNSTIGSRGVHPRVVSQPLSTRTQGVLERENRLQHAPAACRA